MTHNQERTAWWKEGLIGRLVAIDLASSPGHTPPRNSSWVGVWPGDEATIDLITPVSCTWVILGSNFFNISNMEG